MLTIIHGDDTAASRTFYIDIKKRASNPVTLEVDRITLTDVIQVLTGGGLFAEEKDIFIESLITKKKKSAELTAILTELTAHTEANIYLWENKEVDKRTLTSLKNSKSQVFKLPQSLFLFLDNLTHANPKTVQLFHKTLETLEPEMVFFMIIRHLRIMLALSSPGGDEIDELKRLAPWQREKLQRQLRTFDIEWLTIQYKKLYKIDLAQKTGTLSLPLIASIDIWLLEL